MDLTHILASHYINEALKKWFISQSIVQDVVPDIRLKISKITPVDSGDTADPANFRTISPLNAFTEIFEKLVFKQLIIYIEKYDILTPFQFAFRKGRTTEQAITEITDNLKSANDSNLYTCGVFQDFAKAFHTVNHNI